MPRIELAAARLLRGHATVIDPGTAHLEEVDVLPAHARRSLGTRLVKHVCDWSERHERSHGDGGSQLFQTAEQEARRRGCTQIVLMTFSFQAPAFYERHGFEIVATIDEHPRGYQNFLMRRHF